MNTLHRVARNSIVVFASRVIEAGSVFLITMILCRFLKPQLYGDFAFINALVLAFQPLVNLELNTILIREMSKKPERQGALLGSALALKVCLITIFLLAAFSIDLSIGFTGALRIAFYLAVAGEIFQQIAWLLIAVFMSRERMELEALLTLIYKFVSLAGIGAVAWFFWGKDNSEQGFILIFASIALGHLLRVITAGIILVKHFTTVKLKFQWSTAMSILKQTWVMGIATFCTGLSLRVDVYILKALRGSEQVSIFHVPHMFVLQVQIIAIAIVTALFPVVSRWGTDKQQSGRFQEACDLSIRALTVTGMWMAAGTAFFAGTIVGILGGESFLPATGSLIVLAWCIPILFLNLLGANLLIALKKQHYLIYGALSSLLLNIILDFLWIPHYGPVGAAWATLVSYLLQLNIVIYFLKKFDDQDLQLKNSIGIPVIITAAFVLTWFCVVNTLHLQPLMTVFIKAVLLIMAGVVMFVSQPESVRQHLASVFSRRR